MTLDDAPDLARLIANAATEIGATVEDASHRLTGFLFNTEVLSEAISGAAIARQESDLPKHVFSMMLDGFPVLVGTLSGPAIGAVVESQLRRFRNQATIARSWLGADAPNLHTFLVAPVGARSEPAWRQIAAEIESDDRVCRKLVWLPDSALTLAGARRFLERTFIAQPWPSVQRTEALDSVASVSLPARWEEAILSAELDPNELVERLMLIEREAFE